MAQQLLEVGERATWDNCLVCTSRSYVDNDPVNPTGPRPPVSNRFSRNHLFQIFCYCLGIGETSKLRSLWNFEEFAFPFCLACERHMVYVARETLIRGEYFLDPVFLEIMISTEKIFKEQDLYRTHHPGYLLLRDAVLSCGGHFTGSAEYARRRLVRPKWLYDDVNPYAIYTEILQEDPVKEE